MFLGLRPLEALWLLIALVIVGQQIIVRDGVFDPVAFAAAAFFVGLIPAGRGDKKRQESSDDTPISQLAKKLMESQSKSRKKEDEDP